MLTPFQKYYVYSPPVRVVDAPEHIGSVRISNVFKWFNQQINFKKNFMNIHDRPPQSNHKRFGDGRRVHIHTRTFLLCKFTKINFGYTSPNINTFSFIIFLI